MAFIHTGGKQPGLDARPFCFSNQRSIRRKGRTDMEYSHDDIMQYVREEDVKFIRMAFCDVFGNQKNISVMPHELDRAFGQGIAVDASAIPGFGEGVRSDLFLHPDVSTVSVLPWRPEHGKVIRMFCSVAYPGGEVFEADTRSLLASAVIRAKEQGLEFNFGAETEFYLFRCDENGEPTGIPYDRAGYMDIAPQDKGENVRREICLTLERMGILPEGSHHEEGPGQNEIDFRYSEPLKAADDNITFRSVVNTVAARNGLYADFSPKPIKDQPGNGMHINFSVHGTGGEDLTSYAVAGILARAREMTAFLNPSAASYERLGSCKAPKYIAWSRENRSPLIRIPAAEGCYRRAELRSPDPLCNPYLAFTLLIGAGIEGIRAEAALPDPADINLFSAPGEVTARYEALPASLEEALSVASGSEFVRRTLPEAVLRAFLG